MQTHTGKKYTHRKWKLESALRRGYETATRSPLLHLTPSLLAKHQTESANGKTFKNIQCTCRHLKCFANSMSPDNFLLTCFCEIKQSTLNETNYINYI